MAANCHMYRQFINLSGRPASQNCIIFKSFVEKPFVGQLSMRLSITVFVLISLLLSGGCSQQKPAPLQLGTNVWPGYEPLYLARELGELSEDKVRLIEYPSASEVIRAFRNKVLDAASLTLDEILLLVQNQIPVKVVLVHDISDGADVIVAKPDIDSMQALRGRRIAVESSALGAYVLTRALELNGLKLSDITPHSLDVNHHANAYLSGQVDAAVTFEPVRTQLINNGAVEIFNSRQIPGEVVDVLVVHEDAFNRHQATLKYLIDAWFKGLDHLATQPDQAADIIARRQQLSRSDVLASYNGLKLPTRSENVEMLDGSGAKLHDTLSKLNRVLYEKKLLRQPVVTDQLLSGAIVR